MVLASAIDMTMLPVISSSSWAGASPVLFSTSERATIPQ
jgi:hypothetical protein